MSPFSPIPEDFFPKYFIIMQHEMKPVVLNAGAAKADIK
jgi:hypothetical protein